MSTKARMHTESRTCALIGRMLLRLPLCPWRPTEALIDIPAQNRCRKALLPSGMHAASCPSPSHTGRIHGEGQTLLCPQRSSMQRRGNMFPVFYPNLDEKSRRHPELASSFIMCSQYASGCGSEASKISVPCWSGRPNCWR